MNNHKNQPPRQLPEARERKDNGFMQWVRHNKLATVLLILVIAIGLYALIRTNTLQRQAEREHQQLTESYEERIESLQVISMERTVRVFSWAVRSELVRQNMEQISQFFSMFIREQGVQRVMLVNHQDGSVMLSTDLKDEQLLIEDARILQAERVFTISNGASALVVTPVMGLDTRLAVLVVEVIY